MKGEDDDDDDDDVLFAEPQDPQLFPRSITICYFRLRESFKERPCGYVFRPSTMPSKDKICDVSTFQHLPGPVHLDLVYRLQQQRLLARSSGSKGRSQSKGWIRCTPLYYAAFSNNAKGARLLCDFHADPNIKNKFLDNKLGLSGEYCECSGFATDD